MLQTVDEIYKVASISLSPNVPGQIFVSWSLIFYFVAFCSLNWILSFPLFIPLFLRYVFIFSSFLLQLGVMVNPPTPGDISYLQFMRERYICSWKIHISIMSLPVLPLNKPIQTEEVFLLF